MEVDGDAVKYLAEALKHNLKESLKEIASRGRMHPSGQSIPKVLPELKAPQDEGVEDQAGDGETNFVISHSGRGRFRRLPLGPCTGCWRVKEMAFMYYQGVKASEPPCNSYNAYCKRCWPSVLPQVCWEWRRFR